MIFCENCGKPVGSEALHCGHCGAKVERESKKTMLGLSFAEQQAFQQSIAAARKELSTPAEESDDVTPVHTLVADSTVAEDLQESGLFPSQSEMEPADKAPSLEWIAETEVMQNHSWLQEDQTFRSGRVDNAPQTHDHGISETNGQWVDDSPQEDPTEMFQAPSFSQGELATEQGNGAHQWNDEFERGDVGGQETVYPGFENKSADFPSTNMPNAQAQSSVAQDYQHHHSAELSEGIFDSVVEEFNASELNIGAQPVAVENSFPAPWDTMKNEATMASANPPLMQLHSFEQSFAEEEQQFGGSVRADARKKKMKVLMAASGVLVLLALVVLIMVIVKFVL